MLIVHPDTKVQQLENTSLRSKVQKSEESFEPKVHIKYKVVFESALISLEVNLKRTQ